MSFIPPKTRRVVLRAAQHDHEPVLITGQAGSGKSGIARWIHANSPRGTRPFIQLDAGQDWIASILDSQGGTILFPELETLSTAEKQILMSLLKYRALSLPREGHSVRSLVHARLIVPAESPLDEFSAFDPFFLEFRIHMPPLAERSEEFEDIVTAMATEIAHELHKDHLKGIDRMAWAALRSHGWPGNLRELRNVLRVAILQAQGDRIEATDLPKLGHERLDFLASRDQFEKATILELLKTFGGKLEETSRTLRVDVETLKTKMRFHGIDPSLASWEKR